MRRDHLGPAKWDRYALEQIGNAASKSMPESHLSRVLSTTAKSTPPICGRSPLNMSLSERDMRRERSVWAGAIDLACSDATCSTSSAWTTAAPTIAEFAAIGILVYLDRLDHTYPSSSSALQRRLAQYGILGTSIANVGHMLGTVSGKSPSKSIISSGRVKQRLQLRQQKWQQCDGPQWDRMGQYARWRRGKFSVMGLYRTVWDAAPRPPKPQGAGSIPVPPAREPEFMGVAGLYPCAIFML